MQNMKVTVTCPVCGKEGTVFPMESGKKLYYPCGCEVGRHDKVDRVGYTAPTSEELRAKTFHHFSCCNTYDPVNNPKHYASKMIQPIDVVKDWFKTVDPFIAYCLGNSLKYICRHSDKNGVEDLKKAQWYLKRAIEELENE